MTPAELDLREPGTRKAAILLASLDREAADAMLDALDPPQAQQLRRMMVELDRIDPQEEEVVIGEFFRIRPLMPEKHPPGIELDSELARRLSLPQSATVRGAGDGPEEFDAPPFSFLEETEGEKLARVLAGERPQTIALVLSHLSPEQSGSVLGRLSTSLQTEVIHRLIDLEETDPQTLREVEGALQSRLSQQIQMQRRRVVGLKAVADIVEASGNRAGMQILDDLAAHDRRLAERLGGQGPSFDDLEQLDDGALDTVFREVGPKLAVPALVGAAPALVDRILGRLPASEAEITRRRLVHPCPIRLSDVESARREIAKRAHRLAVEGRIELPQLNPAHAA